MTWCRVGYAAIARADPQDHQAAILHALPLLSSELPSDPSLARARAALAILNGVLEVEPDNPGVIHFIIHATDNPAMAPLGLAAARRYAKIAPVSAHARPHLRAAGAVARGHRLQPRL